MSVRSVVSHTYAPIGKTPLIKVSTEINARLYMASAISTKGDLIYMIRNKPFNGDAIVEFLERLLADFDGKLLIIWDNASIHNCKSTRSFLENSTDAKRLYLVQQPSYAPELN
ncbi:MAG: transposase, partial [Bacteroidota bacterium]